MSGEQKGRLKKTLLSLLPPQPHPRQTKIIGWNLNTFFNRNQRVQKEAFILGGMEEHLEEGFSLQLLLNDDTIFEISRELWSPLNDHLKKFPIRVVLTTEGRQIFKVISKDEWGAIGL